MKAIVKATGKELQVGDILTFDNSRYNTTLKIKKYKIYDAGKWSNVDADMGPCIVVDAIIAEHNEISNGAFNPAHIGLELVKE